MRKRSQRREISNLEESQYISQPAKQTFEKKPFRINKNWWVAITLIGIFLLVLYFNTYYNVTSGVAINPEGVGFEKFYLSGPDPYYNMRIVQGTYTTGKYPYYYESDPLLNYPIGAGGGRAPLLNMLALGFSRFLVPFMNEIDAIGYSMQFIPALFGALIIFVIYFIGKELFNKKVGLIAAMFIAFIPAHLSSGHGSAYTLFDHDSLNLLLFFLTFLFLIKSIKEENSAKSLLYSLLGGVSLAGLSLVWVEAHFLFAVIAVYAIVQMFIDIFTNKIEFKVFRSNSIVLFAGYLISFPVVALNPNGFAPTLSLYICIIVTLFGAIYYLIGAKKIPWTISLPAVFSIGALGLILVYFADSLVKTFKFLDPLLYIRGIIFGTGIYGDKISMTIAEANTYGISQTVMSYGPALYWIGWFGLVLLCYYYYKDKKRRDYLLIIVLFLIDIWLAGIAGRFINDMVPIIALLAGWILWLFVDWLNYKQMLRNVKAAGGGFHGIRRGVKFLHVFGIILIVFIVILPNSFIAFDAVVPYNVYEKTPGNWTTFKQEMFGADYRGAYGLGIVKEKYWTHALSWLNDLDNETIDVNRPAFLSWWDYGFYEVALGGHPTVADNFQDGIPPAANFHTATSEDEAVSVWIVRLLEGDRTKNNNVLSDDVKQVLINYLGENNTVNISTWMDGVSSPSYGDPIGAAYDEKSSIKYPVGQQYPINAAYHDISKLLTTNLTSDQITWLYHDLQNITGWSVRYYGVEGYDKQIFNIFAFLSDKSLLLVNGIGDDFIDLKYNGYEVDRSTGQRIGGNQTWDAKEVLGWTHQERANKVITGTSQYYKDPYFETMFYKTYIGPSKGESGSKQEYDYQIPCIDMNHFYAEYISDFSNPELQYYNTGQAAVVIAKYYEGAYVNGSVYFNGDLVDSQIVVQKNLTYRPGFEIPIDHDTDNINESKPEFNLLAGAGAYLQIRRILGDAVSIIKNVTFDGTGTNDSEFAPITDDDAMRKSDNYERSLKINIEPANISGCIFDDKDYDGIYNSSVDEPVNNINVYVTEILSVKSQTDQTTGQTQQTIDNTGTTINVTNSKDGYYNFSGLLPGLYRLQFYDENDYLLDIIDLELHEGNNSYDVKKPKTGDIEGKVFYDENQNNDYDTGEEISGAEVKIYHYDPLTGEENLKGTTITSANGNYSFTNLFPGNINGKDLNVYILRAVKLPDYQYESAVYPVENQTITENISIGLIPVKVSGYTRYEGNAIGNISINFDPDASIDKNTAETNTTTSILDGSYLIDISPGYYNVSISKIEGSTLVYSYNGKLNVTKGQGTATFDISMIKNSTTVNGKTLFEGMNKNNISIIFEPDGSENNTAIAERVTSGINGSYKVEIAPGKYNITVNQTITEDNVNYTYKFSASNVEILLMDSFEYNINLSREAVE
jgi:asparagine N-glycosylation enzyme membrane subunit Stt3/protocatechuate 3,4-dioxygenase beta subunit